MEHLLGGIFSIASRNAENPNSVVMLVLAVGVVVGLWLSLWRKQK